MTDPMIDEEKPQPVLTPQQAVRAARMVGVAVQGATEALVKATGLPGPVCMALLNWANARLTIEMLKPEFNEVKKLLDDTGATDKLLQAALALNETLLGRFEKFEGLSDLDGVEVFALMVERGAFRVADILVYQTELNKQIAGEVGRDT